jgi:DNA invertase Pin-like site-specific DNA recombinase
MTTADAGRLKARRRPRPKVDTRGGPEDTGRNEGIAGMLAAGQSWGAIQNITGCSRATIAKIAKRDRPAA